MIHPFIIYNTQQNHALDLTHLVRSDFCFLCLVELRKLLEHIPGQCLRRKLLQFVLTVDFCPVSPAKPQRSAVHVVKIPLLRILVARSAGGNNVFDQLLHHIVDVVMQILAKENLAALVVDDLTLLVHDVVVLEHILTNREVTAFDLLLRILDRTRKHARLQLVALAHAKLACHALQPLAAKESQKIVFHRQVELSVARVSLTSGTSAQLIVDTSRLVALCAEDAETAEGSDLFLLRRTLCLELSKQLLILLSRLNQLCVICCRKACREADLLLCEAELFHLALCLEIRVAAQNDVGTTAGHVGGDGNGALAACFRNDFSFTLMLLCIEDIMLNSPLL